jgi:hypothetical protein
VRRNLVPPVKKPEEARSNRASRIGKTGRGAQQSRIAYQKSGKGAQQPGTAFHNRKRRTAIAHRVSEKPEKARSNRASRIRKIGRGAQQSRIAYQKNV